MSRSHRSSHPSETCRLEWRPSRLLLAWLAMLGVLGAACVLASEMPRMFAFPIALAAVAQGMALARNQARKPSRTLVWDSHAGLVLVDGEPVSMPTLHWRGPLAFLRYWGADGRWQRLAWWPDTLGRVQRRELRLAAGPASSTDRTGPMAP